MEQDFLKYGDLVTLFGSIPSSIQSPVRRSRRNPFQAFVSTGFLSAIGFTDDRVFLQTVPNPLADPLIAVGDLKNQRELVFQVWPKLSCEAHKQMRKLKKERDLLNGDSDDEEKEATEEAFIKLSNRIKEEKKANQKILEYALNNPVVYGSEVQFMHVSSKSYLKADISCSESDKSAYKFELSDEYSSKMVFKICPKYNVRQEGEPIQFGDQVLIYSGKLDCYVNFSMSNPIEMDKEIPPIDNIPPITKPFDYRTLDEGSQRYEAHISQFRDCLWKIYHYSSYKSEEESMIVRGGDLVRIRHTEHEAFLAADYCMQAENPEVYGRLYYGEFSEESESINSIWEVEIDSRGNKGGNCQILGDKKQYKHIRLRHLLTGRVLETGSLEVGHEVWRIPMLLPSNFMRNSYPLVFPWLRQQPKKRAILQYSLQYGLPY